MNFLGEEQIIFWFSSFKFILGKYEVAVQHILGKGIFRKGREHNYFKIMILDS